MAVIRPDAGKWGLTKAEAEALIKAGENYAAGFLLGKKGSVAERHAQGIASALAHLPLPAYDGEPLWPGRGPLWITAPPTAFWNMYVAVDLAMDAGIAARKAEEATDPVTCRALGKLQRFLETYPRGGGYTHSIVHFDRVLAEGLDSYIARLEAKLAVGADEGRMDFWRALLVVVEAFDAYRKRVADYLMALTFDDPEKEANRARLAEVFQNRLAMKPAESFFEAMAATTFIYALDGSDDLGRFDQFMAPYYEADLAAGRTNKAEALKLIAALWDYVDSCSGWNVALGGSKPDGSEASNPVTLLALEAARGKRRPNLALRLRKDTPDEVWQAAFDTISTGTGLPALYSEENYLAAMERAQLNLPDEDMRQFAFGGCTELMVHGRSCVGSLDGDLSVIKTLEETLPHLPEAATFEDFYLLFEEALRRGIYDLTGLVSRNQQVRSEYHPQLVRSLLIDDCLDRGRHYYAGGARYNWSVINIVGLSNAIDSLSAVKRAVFEEQRARPRSLLAALAANFEGQEALRAFLQGCPRYGNDSPEVNELAARLSSFVYNEFKRYAPYRGGKFLCGTLMFVTYGWYGEPVGATPDGRLAGTPVGDSAGPVQGRDHSGPTAMLTSTAALSQQDAPGTLVVNLRVAKSLLASTEGRSRLKALVEGYYEQGGLQLQLNVVDQAVLKAAIASPEAHGDLIVRVGGYSEYFNNLDETLKLSILERTEHS